MKSIIHNSHSVDGELNPRLSEHEEGKPAIHRHLGRKLQNCVGHESGIQLNWQFDVVKNGYKSEENMSL